MSGTHSPAPSSDPELSVIVTVVDGGAALERCLRALLSQRDAPTMEILLPYEGGRSPIALDAPSAGRVRLIETPAVASLRATSSAGGQHELIDRRRSAGLRAARGAIVAIVEDRGVPRSDWAASLVRVHRERPHLAIGGAVANGCDRLLNWAVFYCDFGRYEPPFAVGTRRYVTDVNVAYKRRGVDLTREVWADRYHEPLVHWALERAGERLLLAPDFVVEQRRDNLSLASLLRERFAWGRLFGAIRARESSIARRAVLTVASPLIPFVVFSRFVRDQVHRRIPIGRLLKVAPVVAVLQAVWAAGEAVGYATARS